MVTCAVLMMVCMLDTGKGVQFLAFIGCVGLMFVGFAPNYLDDDDYPIHKVGALVAAAGCVGCGLPACCGSQPRVAKGSGTIKRELFANITINFYS